MLGLLVALVGLVLDHNPFGGGSEPALTAAAPTTTQRPPAPTTTTATTTTPPPPSAPAVRYLTGLAPDTGGGNVQRVGAHSLRMACGTGESDDKYREVSYLVPPAADHRSFASGVSAAGARDTRIQAQLILDAQSVRSVVVTAGASLPLTWTGPRPERLTLRIVCDPGATAATFTDPALSG